MYDLKLERWTLLLYYQYIHRQVVMQDKIRHLLAFLGVSIGELFVAPLYAIGFGDDGIDTL